MTAERPATRELSAAEARALRARYAKATPFPFNMRPMRVVDAFDHAFHVLKTQTRVVALLLLPLLAPIHLLQAYVGRDSVDDTILDFFGAPGLFGRALAGHRFALTAYLLNLFALTLSGVLMGTLIAQWYAGAPPDIRRILVGAPRLIASAAAVFVAVHVIEAVTAGLAIPLLCVVSPVIGVERAGPLRAIRRSMKLTKPSYLGAAGFTFFSALVSFTLGLLFGWLPSSIASALGDDRYGWVVGGISAIAFATISTAFVSLSAAIYYFNLRMRREGFDIEADAAEAFGA